MDRNDVFLYIQKNKWPRPKKHVGLLYYVGVSGEAHMLDILKKRVNIHLSLQKDFTDIIALALLG